MSDLPENVARARAEKAAYAASIGIDEALIATLVETFYSRIRDHGLLGPIFEERVRDWPAHLAKMKDFWASIALESGRYEGKPLPPHVAIGYLEEAHFREWLGLFFKTLDDVMPNPVAHRFFGERAARIAESLLVGVRIARDGLTGISGKAGSDKEAGSDKVGDF